MEFKTFLQMEEDAFLALTQVAGRQPPATPAGRSKRPNGGKGKSGTPKKHKKAKSAAGASQARASTPRTPPRPAVAEEVEEPSDEEPPPVAARAPSELRELTQKMQVFVADTSKSLAASSKKLDSVTAALKIAEEERQVMAEALQAMEAAAASSSATKRSMDELSTRSEVARSFLPIDSIRAAGKAADAELERYRFASKRFESAAIDVKLASAWIQEAAASVPGADAAIAALALASTSCAEGGRGMLLCAVSTQSELSFEKRSIVASRWLARKVPSTDVLSDLSAGMMEDMSLQVDAEAEAARKKHTDRGAGGFCAFCNKPGHLTKDCRRAAESRQRASSGAAASGLPPPAAAPPAAPPARATSQPP